MLFDGRQAWVGCFGVPEMMSVKLSEEDLLAQVLAYNNSVEGQRLLERVSRSETDERCVQRVQHRVLRLCGLTAGVALCWWVVSANGALGWGWYSGQTVLTVLCGLMVGLLGSWLMLAGLRTIYRRRAKRLRQHARLFAAAWLRLRLESQISSRELASAQHQQVVV
jgi:hypothetical protein